MEVYTTRSENKVLDNLLEEINQLKDQRKYRSIKWVRLNVDVFQDQDAILQLYKDAGLTTKAPKSAMIRLLIDSYELLRVLVKNIDPHNFELSSKDWSDADFTIAKEFLLRFKEVNDQLEKYKPT